MSELGHSAIEFFGDEISCRASPVEKETCGRLRLIHYITEQGREPLPQFISASLSELLLHFLSPHLGVTLPAVEQHSIKKSSLKCSVCKSAHISGEVRLRSIYRKLVTLPACTFWRCRSVLLAHIYMSDTKYGPGSVIRGSPLEMSVSSHEFSDVDNIILCNICCL